MSSLRQTSGSMFSWLLGKELWEPPGPQQVSRLSCAERAKPLCVTHHVPVLRMPSKKFKAGAASHSTTCIVPRQIWGTLRWCTGAHLPASNNERNFHNTTRRRQQTRSIEASFFEVDPNASKHILSDERLSQEAKKTDRKIIKGCFWLRLSPLLLCPAPPTSYFNFSTLAAWDLADTV